MDIDVERWEDVANDAGDTINAKGWVEEKRSGCLRPKRSMFDVKKTTLRHRGKELLHMTSRQHS